MKNYDFSPKSNNNSQQLEVCEPITSKKCAETTYTRCEEVRLPLSSFLASTSALSSFHIFVENAVSRFPTPFARWWKSRCPLRCLQLILGKSTKILNFLTLWSLQEKLHKQWCLFDQVSVFISFLSRPIIIDAIAKHAALCRLRESLTLPRRFPRFLAAWISCCCWKRILCKRKWQKVQKSKRREMLNGREAPMWETLWMRMERCRPMLLTWGEDPSVTKETKMLLFSGKVEHDHLTEEDFSQSWHYLTCRQLRMMKLWILTRARSWGADMHVSSRDLMFIFQCLLVFI